MSQVESMAEIERAIQLFEEAAETKDADAIAGLYAEKATLLPPGAPPIQGREGIRDFWKGFLDAGAEAPVLKTVSVEGSGNLVYEIGEYHVTLPDANDEPDRQHGKYLVVWKRENGGRLEMVADMFSANS